MCKYLLGLVVVATLGCSDEKVEIAISQLDPAGGPSAVVTVPRCPSYDDGQMDRACLVDSEGKTYALSGDGTIHILPASPPYGAYFLFKRSYTPLAQDVTTAGDDASVHVYAGPYNVYDSLGLPDIDPANRIAARASLTSEGGVLVTVHDPLPSGTQVAVNLWYDALYRSRIAPADGSACSMPHDSMDFCTPVTGVRHGFAWRFYVGAAPPLSTSPPQDAGK